MKIVKVVRNTAIISAFAITTAFLSGCGGVSEAEMAQLNNLKSEVNSLQSQANSLKDERANLEKEIAAKTEKLAQCNKEKEETKANLEKLSSK
jgi:outer membrane murein-binding lipoprotein Lpp